MLLLRSLCILVRPAVARRRDDQQHSPRSRLPSDRSRLSHSVAAVLPHRHTQPVRRHVPSTALRGGARSQTRPRARTTPHTPARVTAAHRHTQTERHTAVMSRATATTPVKAATPSASASLVSPSSPPQTPTSTASPSALSSYSAALVRPTSSPLTAGLSCPLTHPLIEQSVLHSLIQQHTRALVPVMLSHSSVVCTAKDRIALSAADVSDDRQAVAVMCGELCDRLSVGGLHLREAKERWEREMRQQKTKSASRNSR